MDQPYPVIPHLMGKHSLLALSVLGNHQNGVKVVLNALLGIIAQLLERAP